MDTPTLSVTYIPLLELTELKNQALDEGKQFTLGVDHHGIYLLIGDILWRAKR